MRSTKVYYAQLAEKLATSHRQVLEMEQESPQSLTPQPSLARKTNQQDHPSTTMEIVDDENDPTTPTIINNNGNDNTNDDYIDNQNKSF